MLDAEEVERSLTASWRLLKHDVQGLQNYDVSIEGFWRSFGAVILALPAFVLQMAGQWRMLDAPGGLSPASLDQTWFLTVQAIGMASNWLVWPGVAMLFARLLAVEGRYVAYMVAYNWSSVLTSTILAAPMALFLAGLALPAHAFAFTLAFLCVILHFRWFTARNVLGVSGGVAAVIVAADAMLTLVIVQAAGFAALGG